MSGQGGGKKNLGQDRYVLKQQRDIITDIQTGWWVILSLFLDNIISSLSSLPNLSCSASTKFSKETIDDQIPEELSKYILAAHLTESQSQNHKIVHIEDISGSHLLQPLLKQGLPRPVSRQLWKTSKRGESTTLLGNMCQFSVPSAVKKCCLMFRENLLSFSLCPLSKRLNIWH